MFRRFHFSLAIYIKEDNKIPMDDKEKIESILPRYCEGQATEEEQLLVKAWEKESDDNRRIVKQMEMLYLAVDSVNVMKKVDSGKVLSKLNKVMIVDRKVNWTKWLQRVAAVLFIPALIAFLVEYNSKRSNIVQMFEAKTNPGMTTMVMLPDSTKVYLNSESLLRYPSSFDGNQRMVELNGEAYFEVTKDAKKRFIVSTPHQSQIEVLGTTFNVEAYESFPEVSTTLLQGKVDFSYQKGIEKKNMMLSPGQKVVYDSQNGQTHLYETNGETEVAWKNGEIIFNNTPLDEALHILGKRYNVAFTKASPGMYASFTGTFTSQRLERILEYFKLSSNIRWRYIDGKEVSQKKTHIEIY